MNGSPTANPTGGSGHCVAQPRAFDVNPLVQIRIAARPLSLNLNDWRSRLIVCDAQVPKQERALRDLARIHQPGVVHER